MVPGSGPCATPLTMQPHMPQMPSRQSWSKATGSSPFAIRSSFSTSSISRKDMCALTFGHFVAHHAARRRWRSSAARCGE